MRELVYVSDAKLRQFRPERRRRFRQTRDVEGEIKIAALGGFKLGKAAQSNADAAPDLDLVVSELERSGRAPRWYEDDSIEAGQWVHFECPMNFRVVAGTNLMAALVVFVGNPPSKSNDHLMLHGSARHLVGRLPMSEQLEPFLVAGSDNAAMEELIGVQLDDQREYERGTARLKRFIDWAVARGSAQPDGMDSLPPASGGRQISRTYEQDLVLIHRSMTMPTTTASWMAGYARVTAVVKRPTRLVVATPLYVERVDGPTDERALDVHST